MIDIQLLRNDLETVAKRLATRAGYALDVARFRELEGKRKEMQQAAFRSEFGIGPAMRASLPHG